MQGLNADAGTPMDKPTRDSLALAMLFRFPGMKLDRRYDDRLGWGIAVYDEYGRYMMTLFGEELVREVLAAGQMFGGDEHGPVLKSIR